MAQQKAVEPAIDEEEDLIDELQPGAKLLKGQYTITRYINSGGFGITYLAKDSLDRDVVIKECFPGSVCRRSKVMVAARSRAHTAELRSIIQLFVKEARSLAKIVHPNIVAVHQVFEDNGTAYMAIDFINGLDLQQIIDGEGRRPTPAEIVQITDKLLDAVGFIHAHDMLHRDISPDNVLIDQDGEPILIDFGAAREKASQTNRAMSALRVVKDGYSPQEFYIAGSEQGPWSDLYALGATLYHLISDEAPVNGQARLAALAEDRPDPYVPLAGRFADYPRGYLEAIDRAMSTLPKDRVQTAQEWLELYQGKAVVLAAPEGVDDAVHRLITDFNRANAPAEVVQPVPAPEPAPAASRISRHATRYAQVAPPSTGGGKRSVQIAAAVALGLILVAGGYVVLNNDGSLPIEQDAATAAPARTKATDTQTVEVATAGTATVAAAPETSPAEVVEVAPDAAPAIASTTESEPAADAPAATETVATAGLTEAAAEAPVAAEASAAADTTLSESEAALLEDASRLSAAEAILKEKLLNIEVLQLPFASPIGTVEPIQAGFAVWDVEMPISEGTRTVGGSKVAVVARISPNADLTEAGDWLKPGVLLYAVNGVPISSSGSLAGGVLNVMNIDPDGKVRVVVDYSDPAGQKKTGLLTVKAVRLVSLRNGVSFAITNIDGEWKTVVTGVADANETNLLPGDVVFREKSTGLRMDAPDSLEKLMPVLAEQGTRVTSFSILRGSKVTTAAMRLTVDPTK
ncbi:serine/threonine-protein kinase [Tabrizicola sp.]|uniref:serine/threonine-protein kinase n=1 Tax=Tabrizicola sp. TaxID=2005166 RepID=UPI003F3298DD